MVPESMKVQERERERERERENEGRERGREAGRKEGRKAGRIHSLYLGNSCSFSGLMLIFISFRKYVTPLRLR